MRHTIRNLLAALGVIAALLFFSAERFPEWVPIIVEVTSLDQVSGPVSKIRDGDTIEVDGTPIRFGSLDCPERGTSAGRTATDQMKELVSGQELICYLNGRQSGDRSIGSCRLADGRDLASLMIQGGACRRYW